MITLAVDPAWAMPGNACAWFDNAELIEVYFRPRTLSSQGLVKVDRLVVERPQIDRRTRHVENAGGSYEKLCAAYDIACAYPARSIRRYTPRQWKGSTPKPQHHRVVLAALTDEELAILPADVCDRVEAACRRGALNRWQKPGAEYYNGWKGHNTLDAVGLGLFDLGRIAK